MRAKKSRSKKMSRGLSVFVTAALIAIVGLLVTASPETGSSRLVSIEQLPQEMAQMCASPEPLASGFDGGTTQIASLQTENLFASMMLLQQRGQQIPAAVNEVTRAPEF